MMASLTILQARLEALDAAIASGVLTVRHGETLTTFRSMNEMIKARDLLLSQIDGLNGVTPTRIRYAYQSGKGL
jgi:hypothetical protein